MELEHEEEYKYKLPQLGKESNLFKKFHCPSCESELPTSALHIADKIGTCPSCNAVFSIEKELNAVKSARSPIQEIVRPEGIDLFYFQDELDITLSQSFSAGAVAFAVMFSMLAVMFLGLYSEVGAIILLIFSLTSFLGFFWSIIYAIRSKKHKIHLNIDDRNLTIKWRPKNFVKDKSYLVNEIDQVYVKTANTHYYLYLIVNGSNGQKHEKVMSLGTSITKAKYLEQEIEHFLGIENRKVLGEV